MNEGSPEMTDNYVALRWRIGRKVGRTIYALIAGTPSDTDPLIGVMDTSELAAAVVEAHNRMVLAGAMGDPSSPTGWPREWTPELVLAADAREWPEGHPCRRCGALNRQHPNAVAACEAWQ